MYLDEAIKKRKSVRRFSDKIPAWENVLEAVDLARYAPMAGNMFSLKFILVESKSKIEKIGYATQQDFVLNAKMILVIVSDRDKVKNMYDPREKGFATQQAGAAIQNILLGLTEAKIATCWVGLFDDKLIKKELSIPDKQEIEAILPLGIETSIKTPEKPRPELDNLVFFEKWGRKEKEDEVKPNFEFPK